uniref:Uncharacterized protein n=1 Tax=Anopheles merus TaxID=30066 RepID=A0A182VG40_ANOME
MTQLKLHLFVQLFVLSLCHSTFGDLPDDTQQSPTPPDVAGDLDARAGPLDLRPPLPTTTASEKPTTAKPLPGLGELLGGGGGLPELGAGGQQSGGSPQASLILGAFQAIITPFNPGMLGTVIGALGGGGGGLGGSGGGGGGAPSLPSFPIGLGTSGRSPAPAAPTTTTASLHRSSSSRGAVPLPLSHGSICSLSISWRRESSACSIKPQ